MRIAYQGEPGAYSEAAALTFSAAAAPLPCRSFEEVFQAVAEGRATLGILPMENSIGGSSHRNYDLLVEHELPIVGEVELKVEHCLLAYPGVTLESRPIRGRPWEYMFYVDLAVSRDDLQCARALVHLAEFARWVRTLGTYRAWGEKAAPTTNTAAPVETVR
jgi:prephenate dehydratase